MLKHSPSSVVAVVTIKSIIIITIIVIRPAERTNGVENFLCAQHGAAAAAGRRPLVQRTSTSRTCCARRATCRRRTPQHAHVPTDFSVRETLSSVSAHVKVNAGTAHTVRSVTVYDDDYDIAQRLSIDGFDLWLLLLLLLRR